MVTTSCVKLYFILNIKIMIIIKLHLYMEIVDWFDIKKKSTDTGGKWDIGVERDTDARYCVVLVSLFKVHVILLILKEIFIFLIFFITFEKRY